MSVRLGHPSILDGGLATELEARGHRLHPWLWSAGVFLEDPGRVREVHADYLACGAEIVVTASYQMSFEGLRRAGLDEEEAAGAMRDTVTLAREAVEQSGRRAAVAASVGPYGAVRCDGSEYRGDYGLSVDELVDFHRRRFEVLAGSGADLLAVETIPSLDEARALALLLDEHGDMPAWISFSCRDERHISDGHGIREAAELLDACEPVMALGINCTAPRCVAGLMDEIRRGSGKPVVVYPNSGEVWDATARDWTGTPAREEFLRSAELWAAKGARGIGGCCRVGPARIRELAERIGAL